ncbi:MAG: hypothetical protein HYZ34_02240, partial [Ignavibacteriae bacterium]|nr:hypothetical protein [Ignavibacteriota bacterium]
QERIKRSKILDGGMIINGGPGTGKTTSLIQRITFLTSPTIKEYYEGLTREEEDILFDQKKGWIFFSPSELLREYLRDAMAGEGLYAERERVRVWEGHRTFLMKEFGYIRTGRERPFTAADSTSILFNSDSKLTLNLIKDLNQFFNLQQESKLKRLAELDLRLFSWAGLEKAIQNELRSFTENNRTTEEYMRFYDSLQKRYTDQAKSIFQNLNENLDLEASIICVKVEQDVDLNNWFENLVFKLWSDSLRVRDADEESDEDTEEDEISYIEQTSFDYEFELDRRLKIWLRKISLNKFDSNTKLSQREREVKDKLSSIFDSKRLDRIGKGAFFKKYFRKIILGVEKNVLEEIPSTYKKFRKDILLSSKYVVKSSIDYLSGLIKNKNNRIHRDEMDLVLLQTFQMIHQLYKNNPRIYRESNSKILSAFHFCSKTIIAIDEATDFSLLQLACMSYLSHPRFCCVTLSGDVMQTMTSVGIQTWEDYLALFPNTSFETMNLSYRQTPRLLELAKTIYQKTTGQPASFYSAMQDDEKDPHPLLLCSNNKMEKIEWLTDRIIEIYKIYDGKIPSIAIFFKDDNESESYHKALKNNEKLKEYDINVTACRNGEFLGEAESVRLFAIQNIKGLEFQAIFFIDIDTLDQSDTTLLERYVYVGLSRANFFLGITINKNLPDKISYLEPYFKNGGWQG